MNDTDTQAQKKLDELNAIYEEAMRELDAIAEEQKKALKVHMDAIKEAHIAKLTKELQG